MKVLSDGWSCKPETVACTPNCVGMVLIANSGGGCSPIWKPPRPDLGGVDCEFESHYVRRSQQGVGGALVEARPLPGPCSLAESRRGSQAKGGAIAPAHRASVGALEVRGAAFTRALPTPGDSRIREHAKPFVPAHRLSHSRSNDSRIRRRNHWQVNQKQHSQYLGEVTAANRAANLAAGWQLAHDQ